MGGSCTKSSRVGVDNQLDVSAALLHAKRAVALSSEASAGGSQNSALERELDLLVQILQPSKRHPNALSQRSVTFSSMLTEDIAEHSDEDAPDEHVVDWLRETLEGGAANLHRAPSRSVSKELSTTEHADPAASQTSLWVLPEVMTRCLSGELIDQPLSFSEAASADALAALDSWDYDTLALQEASGGHALLLLGEALLERHGLYDACSVERATARRFFLALEACYGNNAYHNAMHGADVAVGVHRFLSKFGLLERLSKLQLLGALIGALAHDFNHPGSNNGHEVRARTERARTHADSSVLERHHLHSTFTLLAHPTFDLFGTMPTPDRDACRKLMIDMVLATDLAKHFEFLSTLRALAAEHGSAAAEAAAAAHSHHTTSHHLHILSHHGHGHVAHRHEGASSASGEWKSPFLSDALVDVPLLLSVAVKFADLGHCFKPLGLHKQWTERVTNEFWALGDRERSLGITVSPLCDRTTDTDVPKSQIGFFKFVCVPFYSVVADLIDPTMLPWLRVQANLQTWQLNGATFKKKFRATGQAAVLSRSITTVGTPAARNSARLAVMEHEGKGGGIDGKVKAATRHRRGSVNF